MVIVNWTCKRDWKKIRERSRESVNSRGREKFLRQARARMRLVRMEVRKPFGCLEGAGRWLVAVVFRTKRGLGVFGLTVLQEILEKYREFKGVPCLEQTDGLEKLETC